MTGDSLSSNPRMRCVVLGGGGHARVVIDAALASGVIDLCAVLDSDSRRWGTELFGVPVRGGDELLPELVRQGVTGFVVGVGGVGDNRPRKRLFELGLAHGLQPVTVQHPSAICSTRAKVGVGTVLLAGSVVNAGAVLGVNVILNTGAIVEHDCVIGDHVHLATGAKLASAVRVGKLAHIGIGAAVRQCLSIGEGAVVGAGAVVVNEVAPWTVVVGIPARPLPASRTS